MLVCILVRHQKLFAVHLSVDSPAYSSYVEINGLLTYNVTPVCGKSRHDEIEKHRILFL